MGYPEVWDSAEAAITNPVKFALAMIHTILAPNVSTKPQGHRIQLSAFNTSVATVVQKFTLLSIYEISNFICDDAADYILDCNVQIRLGNGTTIEENTNMFHDFPNTWFRLEKNNILNRYIDTGYIFDLKGEILSVATIKSAKGNTRKRVQLLDDTPITIWPGVQGQMILNDTQPKQSPIMVIITGARVTSFKGQPCLDSTIFSTIIPID